MLYYQYDLFSPSPFPEAPDTEPKTVKVLWSGGKDSTAAAFLHLERGDRVKAVCYIPMLTDTIPLIMPDHFDFIFKTKQKLETAGAERVDIIYGKTYYDYCCHVALNGNSKGTPFGFPCPLAGRCGFNRDSKSRACNSHDVGYFDYLDLGIAFDEPKRWNNLNGITRRSILAESYMDEQDAYDYCKRRGVLSPVYKSRRRDGCALCPQAKADERKRYFEAYPEAVLVILKLQEMQKKYKPNKFPLRDHKWFIEDDGTIN